LPDYEDFENDEVTLVVDISAFPKDSLSANGKELIFKTNFKTDISKFGDSPDLSQLSDSEVLDALGLQSSFTIPLTLFDEEGNTKFGL